MSKFVSNKLAKKINSVAADLCVYRTQNFGACQEAVEAIPTSDQIITKLHAELVAAGILPA